jgi:nucleotide-binding universal stress UspA family protein
VGGKVNELRECGLRVAGKGHRAKGVAHRVEHCSREGGFEMKEFKIIFGSVAERVLKTSPVPVMVVNPYKTDDLNN